MICEIPDGILNFKRNVSGWYLKEILKLEIHKVDHKPLKESSYIPLPDYLF